MTPHEAAEELRIDPKNWKFGFLYYSPNDPRIVVRNRRVLGWTWNFGHRFAYLYLVIVSAVFVSVPIVAHRLSDGAPGAGVAGAILAIAGGVYWAYRVSSGPA